MPAHKKIAIVDNSTWNIYNFRLGLIKKLAANGYRITVIAPVDEYIHYLNDNPFIKHIPLKNLHPHGKQPWRDLMLIRELFQIYKREQPDIILHFTIKPNIFGNLAARFARIPSLAIVTGLGYTFLHSNLITRLAPLLYRLALKKVKKLIVHNACDKEFFIKNRLVAKERCQVISGSGVNSSYFQPVHHTNRENQFVFLFMGRLIYDKGLAEFVEAAKSVSKIAKKSQCWIAGPLEPGNPTDVPSGQFLQWIKHHSVSYFGNVQDIRNFIRQADVIVLPSYREGIPRSILEGMAMGKPIITTSSPGCKETVIDGENGYLVPPKDAQSLAEAMLKMYNLSKEEQEEMGWKSRELALAKFDEEIITSQYITLLEKLLFSSKNVPSGKKSQPIF